MYPRVFRIGGLVLADTAVLVVGWPGVIAACRGLTGPHAWTARVGTDGAVASLAAALLWLVAAWLALGLLAAAGGALPGAAGRLTTAVSRLLLPRGVLRLVAGTAGLSVLLAPVAAAAAPSLAAHRAAVTTSTALPAPTWPTAPPGHPAPDQPPAHTPAPALPTGGAATDASPGVRVRPGDSLWLIAARRLGPGASATQIANAWPRWYAANRGVIGTDPDLLLPGQELTAPDGRP